jgi:hemolysin III
MFRLPVARPDYSRAEVLSDAVVHGVGLISVVGLVPALIWWVATTAGDATTITVTTIYGVCFVLMILASALYNLVPDPRWAGPLKRLDHSAIYLKIAGTYTPFVVLSGQGVWLAGWIWGAAVAGLGLKIVAPDRFRWVGLALYLGMGWVGMIAGASIFAALSPLVVGLMLTGGILYTVGVVFYLWQTLHFHYTIWHVFVLAASLVFYAAVAVQVATSA